MRPWLWLKYKIKESFFGVHHNARVFLLLHPLYVIPYTIFTSYEALYRQGVGLTREEIGILAGVLMLSRGIASLFGGFVTDRLGRKLTNTLMDVVCWSVPALIWAFSRNFAWFFLAAVLNGTNSISSNAFTCSFVEGTRPEKRVFIYSIFSMLGIAAGFFVPAGGWLVGRFGLVKGVRYVYLAAFVSISAMIVLRYFLLRETEIGLSKMEETKEHSFKEAVQDYREAAARIFHSPSAAVTLLLFGIALIQTNMLNSVCHPLFLTGYLGYSKAQYALFPLIGSVVTLLSLLATLPLMQGRERKGMTWGMLILAAGWWVMGHYALGRTDVAVFATGLTAVGWAFFNPGLNTVWANAVNDRWRAKAQSFKDLTAAVVTAPAGYIGARLYALDPRLPYTLMSGLFAAGCLLYVWSVLASRRRQMPAKYMA